MAAGISQLEASDLFDVPTKVFYVCDGKKGCGKPGCLDWGVRGACHHTSDIAHALYEDHPDDGFERLPSVRGGEAAIICVETFRG